MFPKDNTERGSRHHALEAVLRAPLSRPHDRGNGPTVLSVKVDKVDLSSHHLTPASRPRRQPETLFAVQVWPVSASDEFGAHRRKPEENARFPPASRATDPACGGSRRDETRLQGPLGGRGRFCRVSRERRFAIVADRPQVPRRGGNPPEPPLVSARCRSVEPRRPVQRLDRRFRVLASELRTHFPAGL